MPLFIRNLGGPDLLIILAIVVLLFGATKLPELARGMGRSIRIFKAEMAESEKTDAAEGAAKPAELTAPPAPEATVEPTKNESQTPPTA